ncbi:TYRO protein tyrosine kinase-binding protein isoform X1 [Manacus candei]|uniref:TYRO protein tyrosine kinase-binding protein isoform X1 n=1 Tax=Manacus candei TaxID=415023 RepID=UPI002227CE93|nr:TYRO protein tyrosine kinase-binding protein isoform X1 [Manacus candei]
MSGGNWGVKGVPGVTVPLSPPPPECSGWGAGPVAALILTDVALSLALAGAAFWAGGRGRAPPRPRPPEQDSAYQELQGARADLYSELKR